MLSQRAKMLTGSQTSGMRNRARKLRAEGVHIVNFAAGELDQDTSAAIKQAARKAIDDGHTQYTDTLGIRQLREQRVGAGGRKTAGASVTRNGGARHPHYRREFPAAQSSAHADRARS